MVNDSRTDPLVGLRVVELAHYIAGPYAGMILGDLGADVIKIEPPGGEPGRHSGPFSPMGASIYFASYNRKKRFIELDLRSVEGRSMLATLIAESDVVLTNFSLGSADRLGFGFEEVRHLNPGCSMVQITGCGSWSTYASYAAFDGVAQAMSGLADMTGESSGPPTISNILLGDHVSAIQAALAAIAAVQRRHHTGIGSYVEVSMLRALAGLLGYNVPWADLLDHDPRRAGNRSDVRFMNIFPTMDGSILLNPITPTMWREMCSLLDRPDWATSEIAESQRAVEDPALRSEVEGVLIAWLATKTTQDAEILLQSRGVASAGIRSVRQLLAEDEPKQLRLFERVELPTGESTRVMGPLFDWAYPKETESSG